MWFNPISKDRMGNEQTFQTKINLPLPTSTAMFKYIDNIAQNAQAKKLYPQGNKTKDN